MNIPEEHVDIVNEDNLVVGSCSKREAHEKGLLHRTVIAEIINSRGEMVMVRQAGDRQDPGRLVSPIGGHVQAGETEADALKREAMEEAGFRDFEYRYVGRVIFNREVNGRKENHYFILYEINSDKDPVLNEESVEFVRLSKEQFRKEIKERPEQFGDAFWIIQKTFYPELSP